MEKKNVILGVGISVAVCSLVGLYLYFNADEEEEIKNVESTEEVYAQLEEEIKGVVKPPKEANAGKAATSSNTTGNIYVFNEEFTLKVYYLLSKYATKMKKAINDRNFNKRIQWLKEEDEEEYAKVYYAGEKEEIVELKNITGKVLGGLKVMEQDYVFSLNFHSKNPAFREKLTKTQDQIANEIFDQETLNPVIPESLTEQVATEIRDFARDRTNEIIGDLSQKIKDPNLLQEKVSFEIAKLDDIIYLKHGYRNKVVIKAFEKFNLLGQQVPTSNTTAAVVN